MPRQPEAVIGEKSKVDHLGRSRRDASAITPAYKIQLKNAGASSPASLDFINDLAKWANVDTSKLSVFRVQGNDPKNWDDLGGIVDPQSGRIMVSIDQSGDYVLLLKP